MRNLNRRLLRVSIRRSLTRPTRLSTVLLGTALWSPTSSPRARQNARREHEVSSSPYPRPPTRTRFSQPPTRLSNRAQQNLAERQPALVRQPSPPPYNFTHSSTNCQENHNIFYVYAPRPTTGCGRGPKEWQSPHQPCAIWLLPPLVNNPPHHRTCQPSDFHQSTASWALAR